MSEKTARALARYLHLPFGLLGGDKTIVYSWEALRFHHQMTPPVITNTVIKVYEEPKLSQQSSILSNTIKEAEVICTF